jgi:hypothetical protein
MPQRQQFSDAGAPNNRQLFVNLSRRYLVTPLAAATTAPAATTTTPTTAFTAAATTIAATTAAISAPTATVTPAATRSFFAWTSFIHGQWTSFQRLAMELIDRVLRVGFASHRHKSESA